MAWGDEWGEAWGAAPSPRLDLVARMRLRIPTVLRQRPEMRGLFDFLLEQMQHLEEVAERTADHRSLTRSFGASLDRHGVGLNLRRLGLADERYRKALVVRFMALFRHRTNTLAVDLLRALTTDTATTATYTSLPPASYQYTFWDIEGEVAVWWEALLRTAKPRGVRMQTLVVEQTSAAFRFDSGPGYDLGQYAYTLETANHA